MLSSVLTSAGSAAAAADEQPLTANLLSNSSGDAAGGKPMSEEEFSSSSTSSSSSSPAPGQKKGFNVSSSSGTGTGTAPTTADPIRIFPAKYHLTREVLVPIGVSLFLALVAFLIFVTNNSVGVGVVFLAMSGLSGAFAWRTDRSQRRGYETAVFEGRIQEGLFVFPTKDVVVRFNSPTARLNMEFPAGSVSLAQGNDQVGILYILYTDEDYAKRTFNVDCSRLTDRPSYVARALNEVLGISRPAPTGSSARDIMFGEA